jgi:hypothetical protein
MIYFYKALSFSSKPAGTDRAIMEQRVLNTDAIAARERRDIERLRGLSLEERGELLMAACRAAAEIEASRLKMGLPPTQPAPWPESTWQFLAEAAQRVREE